MTKQLFHELCVYRMISDSTEVANYVDLDAIDEWLDMQAIIHGYQDWIDAYHKG